MPRHWNITCFWLCRKIQIPIVLPFSPYSIGYNEIQKERWADKVKKKKRKTNIWVKLFHWQCCQERENSSLDCHTVWHPHPWSHRSCCLCTAQVLTICCLHYSNSHLINLSVSLFFFPSLIHVLQCTNANF